MHNYVHLFIITGFSKTSATRGSFCPIEAFWNKTGLHSDLDFPFLEPFFVVIFAAI